eukprot:m.292319 g.292319  ORF g.292319 m.292319 type:complete len:600 (-) comp12608_c0_seq1:145-1944(-)
MPNRVFFSLKYSPRSQQQPAEATQSRILPHALYGAQQRPSTPCKPKHALSTSPRHIHHTALQHSSRQMRRRPHAARKGGGACSILPVHVYCGQLRRAAMADSKAVLQQIEKHERTNTIAIAAALKCEHQAVVGTVKSLACYPDLITITDKSEQEVAITGDGHAVIADGSPEARIFMMVPKDGITQEALEALDSYKALGDSAKTGKNTAIKNKWLVTSRTPKDVVPPVVTLSRAADSIEDETQKQLKAYLTDASSLSKKEVDALTKRKYIAKRTVKSIDVVKGSAFTLNPVKAKTDLTPEMLADGSWAESTFKPVNIEAMGIRPPAGCLHPLLRVKTEIREIFLEMGFQEMDTRRYVESSFWNFDSLFQPQQHPARDAHDTFFLSKPQYSKEGEREYLERVRNTHEKGGYGSVGYGYEWSEEEASKNILRTHTTAVSSRMLYHLAQQETFKPVKFFSIDRVFRNERLDATHLAEFHQIEGLIADYDLSLADLMGTLTAFFKRLGIENLIYKPAYNPYTEPSMEIFSYHPGLKKVVEIGNSGIFRPEMLRPMGLPENVTVIAWGLSVERPTMIKYGYDNIRSLFGPKVDLAMAQTTPLCRL